MGDTTAAYKQSLRRRKSLRVVHRVKQQREKSPLVLLSGVCFPEFMPGTKMRRDSLKDFFYQLALANRTLNVVSLYDPVSPPEQNPCNFFCAIPGLSACIVSN